METKKMNLKAEFQEKMQRLLKEDYDNYIAGFGHHIGQTFRVNQLKTEPADFFRRFPTVLKGRVTGQVPWCPTGAYYEGETRLSLHPYYQAGLYYIQEPSAMAPAAFLHAAPGDRVLDLCAAPGGKTTALGASMRGEGILIANDISISRCKALLKNIEMAGIGNAIVTCEKPEKLAAHFPEYFDKILVDAPCSGEGMFRKDPSMARAWSEEEVGRYSRLQKEILHYAAAMLKPGGHILYSTCTYSPEENEQVVETLLADDCFRLLPLPQPEGVDEGHPEWSMSHSTDLKYCRRFWNHRVEGEGQFAALIKKNEMRGKERPAAGKVVSYRKKAAPLPEEYYDFMRHLSWDSFDESRLYLYQDMVFYLPAQAPDMKGLRVVSSGLHLGHIKKKRFEPGQALAMALSSRQFDQVLHLSREDERVDRYLRCETILLKEEEASGPDLSGSGWVLLCVDDYPLGWGKLINGQVRNKYPASWRRQ